MKPTVRTIVIKLNSTINMVLGIILLQLNLGRLK